MTANEVKLSAALASERAKTCAACGDPLGEVAYCDVCAEEVRNPALLAKRFPDAYTPDAAALREAVIKDDSYLWGNGRHQRVAGIWFRIVDNKIVDRDQYRHDLESRADALLRSEPRGETK